MIPLVSALADARRAAGLRQRDIATGLGLGAKAGHTMVCNWERGRMIPNVGHACGYARLVSHRIVAVQNGQVVGELIDLMPRLRELLDDAGLSMRAVAAGLFVHQTSIVSVIRRAGPRTQLVSAMSLLGAVGCALDLVPAEAAVLAQIGQVAS